MRTNSGDVNFTHHLRIIYTVFCFIVSVCSNGQKRNISHHPLKKETKATGSINYWITKSDSSILLQKQQAIFFSALSNEFPSINVDERQTMQTIDGFGFALTGGSAVVINGLPLKEKRKLLMELFGKGEGSISISYLRISIGASDLDASVFSYDDLPAGQTDIHLTHFSLAPDHKDLIPLLKEILKINPHIKILATPWSAPAWMKDNNSTKGGSLLSQYYDTYAKYFVKYIQQMKAAGIIIDAIAPQNEPLNPKNNPSLYMTSGEERDFIKNNLGPAFKAEGLHTKIIVYDHNCDHPEYAIDILNDPAAKKFVNGSAFHLYGGDISALSQVHAAHPDRALYFTEQWTGAQGNFGGDFKWHIKNVIIGSMRNWSRVALEWNLASDQSWEPHTPGGCTECKGALTIGSAINRNVGYYIIAHASKFVPSGSVRIGSSNVAGLSSVAFKTPNGEKVLLVENDGNSNITFNIHSNGRWAKTTLDAGSVGTYVWN